MVEILTVPEGYKHFKKWTALLEINEKAKKMVIQHPSN